MNDLEIFYHSLTGKWKVIRHINKQPAINGIVKFRKNNHFLHYNELLQLNNNTNSNKEYFYSFNSTENSIDIFLDNTQKKLFVKIKDISISADFSNHKCKNDLYCFRIIKVNKYQFKTDLLISGPKKQYQISSLFSKI